jgi:hypothetical protein
MVGCCGFPTAMKKYFEGFCSADVLVEEIRSVKKINA